MYLSPPAAKTKSFVQLNSKLLSFSTILIAALTLLIACNEGDEEQPVPVKVNPVITSFTPTTGVAGTTEVVITGENFSATVADNVVKIGNVVATIKAAMTTSITITVPSEAVTGKISVTVRGVTVTSANDFVVSTGPSDFFTLTVDVSYETSQVDTWILASSKSGDWIDVQPYESGETKILNGVVPDANSFTLHFLSISQQSGNYYCNMKSITDVPVNGAWLLKQVAPIDSDPKSLLLNVNNYIIPTDRGFNPTVSVTSNGGTGGYSYTGSGNTVDLDVTVMKSPSDILVTLYENGYPKYVSYKNVSVPSTITLDASAEGVVADRKFTMTLPTNNNFYVAIHAFEQGQDQKSGYLMSNFLNSNGGPSVNLGYMQGYQNYRTLISYKDGKKMVDLSTFGPAVEETHAFPSFDFTFTNSTANDFQALSVLPFHAASISFQFNKPGMVLLWDVVQPASDASRAISFKAKAFPQEILNKHSFLPAVDQVVSSGVFGHYYTGDNNYADMIDEASKNGSELVNLFTDNCFRFGKVKD
jgi:hypothetical protein